MGKPRHEGGLGLGAGPVAGAFAVLMVLGVACLSVTRRDLQPQTILAGSARPADLADAAVDADTG